ncbi:MAG TPA: heliorhodopsin HeR [Candidatus Saccharimonadales bacterium]|nr:heliorhodopsin HeR [Candidatus Saccharimonadales bacterium]
MAKTSAETKQKNPITLPGLHNWNVWLAFIHAIQGAVILLLSTTKVFPVQTSYLTLDPISSELAGHPVLSGAARHLFDINLGYLVAVFFFMSAIAHAVIATIYRNRYEADLKRKINKARWIEYALSASTMMVGIAVLSGVADLSTLLMIFALDAIMNLLGLAMEVYNQGKNKPNWLVYVIGCVAGIVPWFVFGFYVWAANIYGSGDIPSFVYWIYLSMFVLFSSFAVNMYLQYKKVGKWKDYLYGERMYMVLSLVAKTLLAWQIFAGALRP